MQVINSIKKLKKILLGYKAKNKTIGFVPTMGAFHDGHLTLMRRAKKENDIVVVSIFVNPKQFAPSEDYASYPREKQKDISLAKKENIDIMFYPSVEEIYPTRYLTTVSVETIGQHLCGAKRPGHFQGVATVVAKLLNIVAPDQMYLGQKDAQQCVILKQMAEDLNFPVKIKIVPTVREADGLAMSSRNKYLTSLERREAPILYRSLQLAKKLIETGEKSPKKITKQIKNLIQKTSGRIDYVECVGTQTLEPVKTIQGQVLIALAVKFSKARLIDNLILDVH